jgi:tetratricopeptide (TPR) repeat protein
MAGSQGWLRWGSASVAGLFFLLAGMAAAAPATRTSPGAMNAQTAYAAALQAAVLAQWDAPPSVYPGQMCAIKLTLLPGGEVLNAAVEPGCKFGEAGRASLLAAVRQASPLPYRGHESVFQRETVVRFVRPVTPAAVARIEPPAQFREHLSQVEAIEAQALDDEARCLAYPDLPGADWPAGAGKARCSLLRSPMLSLDEIDALLDRRNGAAALDRRFKKLMRAHHDDPAERDQLFVAYTVFGSSEKAEHVAQRWLERSPDSVFAKMALGDAYARQGWKARGTKWASSTPPEQLERMNALFRRAVPLLAEAFQAEKRLSPACEQLAAIGRMSSGQVQRWAMTECLKADAYSFFVLEELMTQAEPRWGGSEEAMRLAAALISARVPKNPALLALTVVPIGYEADRADTWAKILPDTVAASLGAPHPGYMARAGQGMFSQGDRWRGLAFLSQALRFRPWDEDELASRADLLLELGYPEWALRDARRAVARAPDDSRHHYRVASASRAALGERSTREPLLRVMEDAEMREHAYELYCQSFAFAGELVAGEACARSMVAEFPRNAEGWRTLAWILRVQDDPAQAEAALEFLKHQDLKRWPHHAAELERARASVALP